MGNVIQGNFGVDPKDIDLLGAIYEYAKVDCVGYAADKNFCNLSRFSLNQEKAIRFSYEKMQEHVTTLAKNFYENGQNEKDLKLLTDFRDFYQNFELMIIETMR